MGASPLAESVAIILGASSWPGYPQFEKHPAFSNSATDFRDYLLRNGLPQKNLLWLFDKPFDPSKLIIKIGAFLRKPAPADAAPVRNVVFYYVGHGAYIEGSYVVAPRGARHETLRLTTLHIRDIASALAQNAPEKRHVVIIDACYAAGATRDFIMQGPGQPAQEVAEQMREHLGRVDIERGTSLFCAAGARIKAKVARKDRHTMFSGALLRALEKGHQTAGPLLSLDTLAWLVEVDISEVYGKEAVRPELHTPRQEKGDIRELPFFPNPADLARAPGAPTAAKPLPAPGAAPHGLGHESVWLDESCRRGWYELLEVRKEIDRSGDLAQRHHLSGIHGPKEGEIAAIPYGFRAEPQFGTCVLAQVSDLQRGWSLQDKELPSPATRLVGQWQLAPAARADTVHRGLAVDSRVLNSFAMTVGDATLRGHPPTEKTSIHGSFPVRNLRLVVLFPLGYQPDEIIVEAFRTDDFDKPVVQWGEAQAETARIAPGFFFERARGVAILSVEWALPEFNYVLSWRLPQAPTPAAKELVKAKQQVRRLLGLDATARAGLSSELAVIRDAVARDFFLWDGCNAAAADLSLFAYDETAKLIRVVATTLDGTADGITFPWGTGVVGWVMRRRHPAFVDTQDRHAAGIYRAVDGSPPERHLFCLPLPLPIDSDQLATALADSAMPCLVAVLSCLDEQANLGLLTGSAEMLRMVSSDMAERFIKILAQGAPSLKPRPRRSA